MGTRVIRQALVVLAVVAGAWGSMVPLRANTRALPPSSRAGQQGQSKVDVTGSWALEVKTEAGGTTTPSVTLKQDGEKLTGHYSSATLGEADITGTVKGNDLTFGFTATVQGMSLAVTYTGTVESNGSMNGKISLGGLGDGTFTGKKK
jgi:hypothetical protein